VQRAPPAASARARRCSLETPPRSRTPSTTPRACACAAARSRRGRAVLLPPEPTPARPEAVPGAEEDDATGGHAGAEKPVARRSPLGRPPTR
jgi:hypothetical protein